MWAYTLIQIVPINLALLIYTIYKSGCLRAPTTNILMYTYRPLVIDLAYFRDRKLKKDVYWSIHCNEKNESQSSKFRCYSKTRPQKYSRQFYEHRLSWVKAFMWLNLLILWTINKMFPWQFYILLFKILKALIQSNLVLSIIFNLYFYVYAFY